jgi:16S rRNA (uracil1498-N3)-methyltransferase
VPRARFFVDADLVPGQRINLPSPAAHHAAHVLRLRDGDTAILFNGRGGEYSAKLAIGGTAADIEAFDPADRESPLSIALLQAWVALDKIDWIVEKSVELGVARIALMPARRGVVRLDGIRLAKRVARLRDIAIAACCQSGRNRVPPVDAFDSLASALSAGSEYGACGVLLDPHASESLQAIGGSQQRIAIAVGPEGGFDDDEIALAGRAGFRRGRLGPRVLRTETAGLAALAALQATAGDLR